MTTTTSTETRNDMEQEKLDRDVNEDHQVSKHEQQEDLDLAGANLLNSSLAFLFQRRPRNGRSRSASII
jgi:hypothetical protein